MSYLVNVTTPDGTSHTYRPEDVAFLNHESYGPVSKLGVKESSVDVLLINVNNVATVRVEHA